MPHDPIRVEETGAWFLRAEHDLRGARAVLDAQPPLVDIALFHCQQAAEKAMKGFLTWHNEIFRRTHDLAEIGGQCAATDPSLEPLCQRAERLTVFATLLRYPGVPQEPPQEEGENALRLAREVYDTLLDRLPDEVSP